MADAPELADLLACPRCDAALAPAQDEGFECRGCQVHYPLLDGLPFLFSAPRASLGEWQARVHHELRRLEARAEKIESELLDKELLPLTRERLEQVRDACRDQHAKLAALMAPLLAGGEPATRETYIALRTRLPSDQGLNTYYQNVHRDWAWATGENAAAADIVLSMLPEAPGRVLVLGAGSGRLAYDLHQCTKADLTVALDFNPLLAGIGARVSRGEAIELWEFPIAPRSAEDCAVLREFDAEPARPGLEFVLGDALRAPFRKAAFDMVITPWLVDIVPLDFAELATRVNGLLAKGGSWMNFGSLAFDTPEESRCYTLEECVALVGQTGFDDVEYRTDRIPYMCSPASRHGRMEEVVSFRARKDKTVKTASRYQSLPEWLVTGKEAVPALPSFQMQAASNRIYAFVMGLIDGQRSIADMARLLEAQKLMAQQEAEGVIRDFMIRMYEDSRRSS
ncbi:MAG: hypothetical protein JSV45_11775 [Chromatiales bacterium]|nr:MAG: hypothetical protein JSV45_11775 [Chromatiales bacterium]